MNENEHDVMGELREGRPYPQVFVSLCDLELQHRADRRLGAFKTLLCRAIISTGQMHTSVSRRILSALGLKSDFAKGKGRETAMERGYCLSLVLQSITGETLVLPRVYAAAHEPGSEDVSIVIGVDALKGFSLVVDWEGRHFTLTRGLRSAMREDR